MESPETRQSLLLRIRDRGDQQAWTEFVEIYQPLIYRLIRQKGFQDADAQNLSQEALIAVSRAVDRWDPDPQRGSFRGWLFRTTRNMMINFLARSRPDERGTGDSDFQQLLEQHPAPSEPTQTLFDHEYKCEVFQWAAQQVRGEVAEKTWRAFWLTAVEGRGVPETAEALGLSIGSVYAARSRLMSRLKRKVSEWGTTPRSGRENEAC